MTDLRIVSFWTANLPVGASTDDGIVAATQCEAIRTKVHKRESIAFADAQLKFMVEGRHNLLENLCLENYTSSHC